MMMNRPSQRVVTCSNVATLLMIHTVLIFSQSFQMQHRTIRSTGRSLASFGPSHTNRGGSLLFSDRKEPNGDTQLYGKKILIAFDGSQNNARDFHPDQKTDKTFTNVLKLHLLAGGDINGRRNDIPGQISLYERGVGGVTESSFLSNFRSVLGNLKRQTKPMLRKLEEVYEPGDRLYMIGFSRGASAARAFAVQLSKNGLTTKDGEKVKDPPIEFLGCFETVSMQTRAHMFQILRTRRKRVLTPSTVLGEEGKVAPNVKKAVHNVALDDNRQWSRPLPFPPVLMGIEDRVHEAWFAGEHGDVGGDWYTKGMPDCSCKSMQEWMESAGLNFIEANDIDLECVTIDDHPEIEIKLEDLRLLPDPSDKIHLNDECQRKTDTFTPDYRPVLVFKNDKKVPEGSVNVHESVLYHMEAMKKAGNEKYHINPLIKETDFVVVGTLGKVLDDETKRLKDLLKSDY